MFEADSTMNVPSLAAELKFLGAIATPVEQNQIGT
jgi:hypothetical protein